MESSIDQSDQSEKSIFYERKCVEFLDNIYLDENNLEKNNTVGYINDSIRIYHTIGKVMLSSFIICFKTTADGNTSLFFN